MKRKYNVVFEIWTKFCRHNRALIKIKEIKEYIKFNRSFKNVYSTKCVLTASSECFYRQTYYNEKNKIFVSLCMQKNIEKLKACYQEADNDKVYSDEYFENRMSMRIIAKHICHNIPKDSLILDAACGHGAIDMFLSLKGYKVTGIDLNPNRINMLKRNIYKAICIDLDSIHENSKYDVIIALEMLEHVPDILHSLKIIYNLLRGGGIFYASVPNEFMIDDEQHIRILNKDSMIKLMNLSGFQVVNISKLPYLNCEKDNDLVCVAIKP